MSPKSLALILVAALTVGGAALGGGVRRYRARPQQLCAIPDADYQPPHPPPMVDPVLAVSKVGTILTPSPPATAGETTMSLKIAGQTTTSRPRIKLYQFIPTALAIDHCSISRLAMTIDETGYWRLNLQADQNPQVDFPPAGIAVPVQAQTRGLPAVQLKQTTYLKRNLFVIRVRGLGAFPEATTTPPAPPDLGKPVLLAIPPIQFWVQRGVPYPAVFDGVNRDAATLFDLIDRIEIEFSYR
jgi:hypothetical protein